MKSTRHVLACIDTSATPSALDIENIKDNLDLLTRILDEDDAPSVTADVVEFGCGIHRVLPFAEWNTEKTIHGGTGGCDYSCIFDPGFLVGISEVDIFIIFTDGFGSAPEKSPTAKPVIWTLLGQPRRFPASWGKAFLSLKDFSKETSPFFDRVRKERQEAYAKKGQQA